MSDESTRDFERAVIAGDETQRRRLEAIYIRTGAVDALADRIVECVGSRILVYRSLDGPPKDDFAPCVYNWFPCVYNWFAFHLKRGFTERGTPLGRCDYTIIQDGDKPEAQGRTAHGVSVLLVTGANRCHVVTADDFTGRTLLQRAMRDVYANDRTRLTRILRTWPRRVTAPTPLVALWAGLTCDVLDRSATSARLCAQIEDPKSLMRALRADR